MTHLLSPFRNLKIFWKGLMLVQNVFAGFRNLKCLWQYHKIILENPKSTTFRNNKMSSNWKTTLVMPTFEDNWFFASFKYKGKITNSSVRNFNAKSFFLIENHYSPISQANWCNMTFTAGNLLPSHSCISVMRVKPTSGFELRSSQTTQPLPQVLI